MLLRIRFTKRSAFLILSQRKIKIKNFSENLLEISVLPRVRLPIFTIFGCFLNLLLFFVKGGYSRDGYDFAGGYPEIVFNM